MKKIFVLSIIICFGMICSCQKQDSAVEQRLAQRIAELEASEKASDEREKALEALVEREKALAERKKATASTPTSSPDQLQRQVPDPAQLQAERDRRIQEQLAQFQGLIPNPSQATAEMNKKIQDRLAESQRQREELQRMRSGLAAPSATAATSPPSLAVYPQVEATSPTPSPAVEATSPTPSPTPH